MRHILNRVDAGNKNCRGNQEPEEKGQRIHFHRYADGIASCGYTVAHPVGNHLSVHHNRPDQGDHACQGYGDRQDCYHIPEELALSQHNNQKCAKEQNHHRINREVGIVQKVTHPCSLLISLVSRVP